MSQFQAHERKYELRQFSVCDQEKEGGWAATLDDGTWQFKQLHEYGKLQLFVGLDLFSKSNRRKFAKFDGWGDKMLKGFEDKVNVKTPTEMMMTLTKTRSSYGTNMQ